MNEEVVFEDESVKIVKVWKEDGVYIEHRYRGDRYEAGDELVSKFQIHEQIHIGSPLTKISQVENTGIIVKRRDTIKFYRLSDYLSEESRDE